MWRPGSIVRYQTFAKLTFLGMEKILPADRLEQSIVYLMRYFVVHINPILHRTSYRGRSFSEYEIIVPMALSLMGAMRPTDLSRDLCIEKGSMTSILKRLREMAMIERVEIPNNERSYLVQLTEEGRAFVRHLEAQRSSEFRRLFAEMSDDEAKTVARGIDRLADYLQKHEENHGLVRQGRE